MVKKKRWESGILPEIAIKEQVSFNIKKNIPFKYPKGGLISERFSFWFKFQNKDAK